MSVDSLFVTSVGVDIIAMKATMVAEATEISTT